MLYVVVKVNQDKCSYLQYFGVHNALRPEKLDLLYFKSSNTQFKPNQNGIGQKDTLLVFSLYLLQAHKTDPRTF